MPLADRDVNTQRDLPRNKRHSIQHDLSYARLKDENSPSLRGKSPKSTPPSQRLLAPTKASAARSTSTPRASGPSPSPSQSKLPLRSPTPKWTARIANRISSADKAAREGAELQKQRENATVTEKRPDSEHTRESRLPANAVPAPDKPLPSRPVVSLMNEMSPTKDSRTLMDASEQPLTISVAGSQHDWPTLTPHSSSIGSTGSERGREASTTVANFSTPSNYEATKGSNARDFPEDAASSERSSSSTFLSANAENQSARLSSASMEDTAEALQSPARRTNDTGGSAAASATAGNPPRKASLRYQPSNGSLAQKSITKASQIPRGTTPDSRPHSPSPASFSRPRPSSISLGGGIPLPTSTTPTPASMSRGQKTASRIPIPDPKKAMLVDVKSRGSSSTGTGKSEHCPSFGSRRLDAPDTLKILDQGIKRRQLRRTDTTGTTTTTASSTFRPVYLDHPSDPERSGASTPDHTFATSSSEGEEVTTPTFTPGGLTRSESSANLANSHTNSYYQGAAVKLFDNAVSALNSMPPPTNPYAAPLQTIHSQASLPAYGGQTMSYHSRNSSAFADMKKRFSQLHAAHADHTAAHIGERAPVPESTRFSLMDILNEYANEHEHIDGNASTTLDDETKGHISRTLSALEGNGLPSTEMDNETLLTLFGHLKRTIDKRPKTFSFVDNAAAADKFLASTEAGEHASSGATPAPLAVPKRGSKPELPPIELIASQWSDSTTSPRDMSPVPEEMSPYRTKASTTTPLVAPPKRLPPDPPRSIGYPSRVPSKVNALIGPSGSSPPPLSEHMRRISTPTLGKRTPGSVRSARETLHQVQGFARTTASAESKKNAKLPTPTRKPLPVVDKDERGRVASAEKTASKSDYSTPRARSKSRYVLDKLNGLFSAKHNKRNSALPPMPSTAGVIEVSRDVSVNASGSPILNANPRGPPVTKMPTLSKPEYAALRSASTATSDETPIDSVTAGDQSDDNASAQSLMKWSATLVTKAKQETNVARKERLLNFAKVLNDSLISAREAQISAETAQHAAKSAQLSYEMTQKSVVLLQRLAASMAGGGARR